MFKNKKKLKEIENIKKELANIKDQLEGENRLIDINDLYVWENNGIYNIVKLDVKEIYGRTWIGAEITAYKSTLKDIFTNKDVFILRSTRKIHSRERIKENSKIYHAYLKPISKVNKKLKLYPNKKVPLYVLHEMYNSLNDIKIDNSLVKKI